MSDNKAGKPRARDLGVPFEGQPGPLNAITDVAGVEVGHTTLISGDGPLVVGKGPVRTGVTAILPRGKASTDAGLRRLVLAQRQRRDDRHAWLEESGLLEGPIVITNTHSVGVVRDAVIAWPSGAAGRMLQLWWSLPVVAETYDGWLNDINGFHVKPEHVFAALDGAPAGPVAEGNVGGGTGMICYGFKGGIGTASRELTGRQGGYTVGVLVQANYGARQQLRIAGVPVGPGDHRRRRPARPRARLDHRRRRHRRAAAAAPVPARWPNAPPSAWPAPAASPASAPATSSSPSPPPTPRRRAVRDRSPCRCSADHRINPLFEAAVQATEEAILNALVAAETMTGRDGHTAYALPHDLLQDTLKEYGRSSPDLGPTL